MADVDVACAIYDVPPGSSFDLQETVDFTEPVSRPEIEAAFEACVTAGTSFDLELTIVTATGRHVPSEPSVRRSEVLTAR